MSLTIQEAFDAFPDRCPRTPAAHQVIGVERIVLDARRAFPGCYMLADEMGAGKSKQSIDAAQVLFTAGQVDMVVVIAPASPRTDVWWQPETGELRKHLWPDLASVVTEYHSVNRTWRHAQRATGLGTLGWVVTNYEFLRDPTKLKRLLVGLKGRRVMLILDESSQVKGHTAAQTKAANKVRKQSRNVVLLNGTPITQSPADLFSQGRIMDPRIIGLGSWTEYRGKYAVMGGFEQHEIVGWRHEMRPGCCARSPASLLHAWDGIGDLQKRFAPYVIRRLKRDCFDLPQALEPQQVSVPLRPEVWALYREMEEDLISYLETNIAVTAKHAGSKALRLAQITSGFSGGVEMEAPCSCAQPLPDDNCSVCGGAGSIWTGQPPIRVGDDKVEFLRGWTSRALESDPDLKLLVWCRFRPEVEIVTEVLRDMMPVLNIWGGQGKAERTAAVQSLDPGASPPGRRALVGTVQTGAMGLNLSASHTVVYFSNDPKLLNREQSLARVDRPGQTCPVSYYDLVATGPKGQKTVDHVVLRGLRERKDVADWTSSAWVEAIKKERSL